MDKVNGAQVVERMQNGDVVGALGFSGHPSQAQLRFRANRLRQEARAALPHATRVRKRELQRAVHGLNLLERVVSDASLRRCWDSAFANPSRLPDGADLSLLAAVHWDWRLVFPELSREASALFVQALRAAAVGDLVTALDLAEQAVRLSPFDAAFRGVVRSWRDSLASVH